MINFRYHIVSLMAVFLALSVGIVLGVTLRGPVNEGLLTEAAQDRKQVQELRTELDRRDALDDYRDAHAFGVGQELTQDALSSRTVALVTMPDAPTAVLNAIKTAVTDSGGVVTHTVRIDKIVFDPSKAAAVAVTLDQYGQQLQLEQSMSNATKLGLAVGRAVFTKQAAPRDAEALALTRSLTSARLIAVDGRSTDQAELAIVVTAEAAEPRPTRESLDAHVQLDAALKTVAAGVVVAGPNSEDIEGTDVLTVRTDPVAVDQLSTVDVADLPSGVATTVLAGKEQLLGGQGHYGGLTRADAPLPELPVR